jgi:phage baseplate assembly protein W
MATIRLDNLKKNVSYEGIPVKLPKNNVVYSDLHLDLVLEKNIGKGDNPVNTNDLRIDKDLDAIKNSIRNIFSTKKGQKILSPEFGASLEQYLFERVDIFFGNLIGEEILRNLSLYEPRVEVIRIDVLPIPDQNEYKIKVLYRYKNLQKEYEIIFNIINNGQINI